MGLELYNQSLYYREHILEIKRAIVFAGYSYDGFIFEDVYSYLKELKKYSDCIVAVYDNNALNKSATDRLLNECADVCIIGHHGEYDFGSYKKGYLFLKEKGVLNSADKLIFCNDSVIFQGRSLEPFFKREEKKDFYGFTRYKKGIQYNTPQKNIPPHIQSYFLSMSKEIFSADWFNDFIMSIKKEADKQNVIMRYEFGINRLMQEHGYELTSFYPALETEPCRTFLARFSGFHEELPELFFLEKRQYAIAYKNGVMM